MVASVIARSVLQFVFPDARRPFDTLTGELDKIIKAGLRSLLCWRGCALTHACASVSVCPCMGIHGALGLFLRKRSWMTLSFFRLQDDVASREQDRCCGLR